VARNAAGLTRRHQETAKPDPSSCALARAGCAGARRLRTKLTAATEPMATAQVRGVRKLVWRPALFRPGKATLLVVVRTAGLFPGLFAVIVPGELAEVNPLRPAEATDYRTALDELVSRTPPSP